MNVSPPLLGLPLDRLQVHAFLGQFVEWRHLPQALDHLDRPPADPIHFLLGVEPMEAEADRRVRQLGAGSERRDDVRGLERRRRAGRARRQRALLVEPHQHRLPFDVGERDVQVVGQSPLDVPVQEGLVDIRQDGVLQLVAQPRQPHALLAHGLAGDLGRLAEADDERHGQRARPHAPLVAALSWIVPISLLANITETRTVLSVIALPICSTSIRPSGCTGTYVTSEPCRSRRLATSRPARCSMTVVTMWLPFSRYISATPL